MTQSKSDADAESSALFRKAVTNTKKLNSDTVEPHRRKPPPRKLRRGDDFDAVDENVMERPHASGQTSSSGDTYRRNGVQERMLKKLRRGQFPVVDEVDLHGLRVEEARRHLARFIAGHRRAQMSCVRVIHGKGLSSPGREPVLKPLTRQWLQNHPRVLAFVPAALNDGGSGALYVLLRGSGEDH
ncbi:MAG: Smr/MutS family protein [Pseudomonadota bacterium]